MALDSYIQIGLLICCSCSVMSARGQPAEKTGEALISSFGLSTEPCPAPPMESHGEVVQIDSRIYRASYNRVHGTGDLIASSFSFNNGTFSSGTELWSAAAQLDSHTFNSRTIFTWNPIRLDGVPFRYAQLTMEQRTALASTLLPTDAGFEAEVTRNINYLRGDSTAEQPRGPLRKRPSSGGRLGGIVNSKPVYYGAPNRFHRTGSKFPQAPGFTYPEFAAAHVGRQAMLYVAANDGMLHAFNADTGAEAWGFIPDSSILGSYNNRVKELSSVSSEHYYINDLTPTIEDVSIDVSGLNADVLRNWTTIVIGGLGAGGKGYYALDITDSARGGLSESSTAVIGEMVLWEFTDRDDTYPSCVRPAAESCIRDQALVDLFGSQLIDDSLSASEPYRDLGFSLSKPTVAMSNLTHNNGEHEWIVLFGNGYNSSSGRSKLYILRIERGIDGEWCHPDRIYDGNEENGDTWDHAGESQQTVCPGGADFLKIETAGPINVPFDSNNDGDFDDPDDNPDRIFANGLGTPLGIDINRDGTIDFAYAGDRFGNLYRFDLTSDEMDQWTGELMFQAVYDSYPQPITTRPFAVQHPDTNTGADCDPDPDPDAVNPCGGFIIIIATGSQLYKTDVTDRKISSIYGVWERFQTGLVTRSDLVEQELVFTDATQLSRTLSSKPVDYSLTENGTPVNAGYYIDLDSPGFSDPSVLPFAGEKAIRDFQEISGVISVDSVIPPNAGCTSTVRGASLAFCAGTGGLNCISGSSFVDVDSMPGNEEVISQDDHPASLTVEDSTPVDSIIVGESRITQTSDGTFQSTVIFSADEAPATENTGRLSWKQLK